MAGKKKEYPKVKPGLHPRNRHRARYDFPQLVASCPELAPFVQVNTYNDESIDFFDPEAVKMLNRALLKHHYGIGEWEIPEDYLCPPIPGRADYLHHAADLLTANNGGQVPRGAHIRVLDIGTGANCIYPMIGTREYGWSFVGTDIDPVALASAARIIERNPVLTGAIELREQTDPQGIFTSIIQPEERFDLSVCNPPFHASREDARAGTLRKLSNLKRKNIARPVLNFGGQQRELWCEGGEVKFVGDMIEQSRQFATACCWFSTLIARQSHLKGVYEALQAAQATAVKTLPMGQGNKSSRIVAWTFLSPAQQAAWSKARWQPGSTD